MRKFFLLFLYISRIEEEYMETKEETKKNPSFHGFAPLHLPLLATRHEVFSSVTNVTYRQDEQRLSEFQHDGYCSKDYRMDDRLWFSSGFIDSSLVSTHMHPQIGVTTPARMVQLASLYTTYLNPSTKSRRFEWLKTSSRTRRFV